MLKNYLTVAFRTLRRHKGYTLINVFGLAVGIACCVLMLLYMRHELRYDQHHEKASQTYRLTVHTEGSGPTLASSKVPLPAAPTLLADLPAVAQAARIFPHPAYLGIPVITVDESSFLEKRLFYVDASLFEVFRFAWLHGDPQAALAHPNSVVITETIARKYFGDADPLGKPLQFQRQAVANTSGVLDLRVSGVVRDLPGNTHFHFDFLVSSVQFPYYQRILDNWFANEAWTYVVLPDDRAVAALEGQFPAFVQRYFPEEIRAQTELRLQPLEAIHLHSHLAREIEVNGNIVYVYILAAVALFVLVIACMNFTNLATARSATRAREVGMRKVLGAHRVQLAQQFLSESLMLSFSATLIAIALVWMVLPLFSDIVAIPLVFDVGGDAFWWMVLLGGGLGIGVLGGAYPAFLLSGFTPTSTLKSRQAGRSRGQKSLRKVLVVTQFTISIVLLICIGIITQQFSYICNKDLGFSKEEIVFVRLQDALFQQVERLETFKGALLDHEHIVNATGTWSLPGSTNAPVFTYFFEVEGAQPGDRTRMALIRADEDFITTFGVDVVEGRAFDQDVATDETEGFILSEAAVKALGWEASPLGKHLEVFSGSGVSFKKGQVIGVIKDLHHASLYDAVQPLVLSGASNRQYRYLALQLHPEDATGALTHLKETWRAFTPEVPIEIFFLDEDLNNAYQQAEKFGAFLRYFALLAIFLGCLGLFGLAAFTAERRTKEIGIRKVLGASVPSLVNLLSKDFLTLVALAFLVAVPLAYLAMSRWLEAFAYRVALSEWIFLVAGLAAFGIALLTVSYQAVKAALADPVQSLRYE